MSESVPRTRRRAAVSRRRSGSFVRRCSAAVAVVAACVATLVPVSANAAPATDPLCSSGVVSRLTDLLVGTSSSSGWTSMSFDAVTGVDYVSYFDGLVNKVAAWHVATHTFLACGVVVGTNLGDTHDGANLHVDKLGYLHVLNGRHGAPPLYSRSATAHDADLSDGFVVPVPLQARGGELPMAGATYPVLYDDVANPRNLIVSARKMTERGHAQVQTSWSTNGGKSWTPGQIVVDLAATRPDYKVYSSLAQSDDGTLHLIWSPRLIVGQAPCDTFSSTGIYYAKSTDFGHTWTTAAGAPLTLPITEATEPAAASVRAPMRIQAAQPTPVAFDAAGHPVIVYRQYSDTHCHKPDGVPATLNEVRWTGSTWTAPRAVSPETGFTTYVLSQHTRDHAIMLYATQLRGSSPRLVTLTSTDDGATWSSPRCLTTSATYSVTTLQSHTLARKDQDLVAYATGTNGYLLDAKAAPAVRCPPPTSATAPAAVVGSDTDD